jgi:hypothetical protein
MWRYSETTATKQFLKLIFIGSDIKLNPDIQSQSSIGVPVTTATTAISTTQQQYYGTFNRDYYLNVSVVTPPTLSNTDKPNQGQLMFFS